MSLSQKKDFINVVTQEKDQVEKIDEYRTKFINLVKEWGFDSTQTFLIQGEFLPNPNVKRPRTKIDLDTRQKIVDDLKSGTLSTNEISSRYGVTVDAVYNIKSKVGLTKPREMKMEQTPTVTPPTPQTVGNPTTVPTPPTGVQPTPEQMAA